MRPTGIGALVKTITDKMKVNADADLKSHNLTLTQSRILGFLYDRGGQATQKEIEDFLDVSHPTVVGVVARMEEKGHVTTWLDTKIQRSKMVKLTQQAEVIAGEMTSMIVAREKVMLHGLSQDEIAKLHKMLQVIYQNLD